MEDQELIKKINKLGQDIKPNREFVLQSKVELIERARTQKHKRTWWATTSFKVGLGLVMATIIITAGIGATETHADSAKPGDLWYSADRFVEEIKLRLPQKARTRYQYRLHLIEERLQELDELENLSDEQLKQKKREAFRKMLLKDIERYLERSNNTELQQDFQELKDEFRTLKEDGLTQSERQYFKLQILKVLDTHFPNRQVLQR
jgi:hypothetical protein